MIRFTVYILPILCVLVFACQRQNKENTLTEEELISLAMQQGDLISENTQKVLGARLKEVIQDKGIPQALTYCNLNAYPLVDSLQDIYKAGIRRASLKIRNPADAPDKREEKIIKEYLKEIQEGKTPVAKVVLQNDKLHYYRPIILSAQLCLNCHGNIGTDIKEDNYRIIRALYGDDKATGHKIGDLRGIWSITFHKESLGDK
jgi:hypothetical protein